MKRTLLTLHIFSLFIIKLSAQAPAIEWQKCMGGSLMETIASIQETSDDGYIGAGYSQSTDGDVIGNHGIADYWMVKLDNSGNLLWQKSLGGSLLDFAISIQLTSDGGYIVAGYSESTDGDVTGNHGEYDYWVVKLDESGNIQWQRSLGGVYDDLATSIVQTSDGGYIVAGTSESNNGNVTGNHGEYDYWVVKLDGSGTLQWQRALGGSRYDEATSIVQTSDGGYIVAGTSESNNGNVTGNQGGNDSWVVKLDESGTIQWQRSLGGSDYDAATSIVQTSNGGYLVAGYSRSTDGDVTGNQGGNDSWVVKLDESGIIQWQRSLGGSDFERAKSVLQTSDGGYIVAGHSKSTDGDVVGNHGALDYWVVKLHGNGILLWQKCLGGSGHDEAYSILQTSNGGYIVAGYSESTDGDVTGHHGFRDSWVVKLGSSTGTEDPGDMVAGLTIYPNPAGREVRLAIQGRAFKMQCASVTDMLGRTVLNFGPNPLNQKLDVSTLPNGLYTVTASLPDGEVLRQRLLVQK